MPGRAVEDAGKEKDLYGDRYYACPEPQARIPG